LLKIEDPVLLAELKKGFPHHVKEWAKANLDRAKEVTDLIRVMAKQLGVGLVAVLLIFRAIQCNWNIWHDAINQGTTALGVITKAYVNLFKAVDKDESVQTVLKPQYHAIQGKPVYGVRSRGPSKELSPQESYHIFVAICKACKISTTLATGQSDRKSAGADSEFGSYD